MEIFELHFNSKAREDKIFDSFCYEPETASEKKLGGLYMAGELRNTLPQNSRLLGALSQVIKNRYYALSSQTPEKSLRDSLKTANEFLADEVSKDNVSWLGNLNFSILSLVPFQKSWLGANIYFTKIGSVKILLLREGKVIDLSKNLDLQDIEPYPLKIFNNIVTGKISSNDIVLILSKDIFEFFSSSARIPKSQKASQQNLIQEIARLPVLEEKKLKEILKSRDKELSSLSGVCLVINCASSPHTREKKFVAFQKELEEFSIKEALFPLTKFFQRIFDISSSRLKQSFRLPASLRPPDTLTRVMRAGKALQTVLPQINLRQSKTRAAKSVGYFPKEKLSAVNPVREFFSNGAKKNSLLLLIFILFLLGGFFIFRTEEKRNLETEETILTEVRGKINRVENLLIFKNEKGANELLKEAWDEILPLSAKEGPLNDVANSLKQSIEEKLETLNKMKKIDEPEVIFEFNPKEFVPEKMVILRQNLYFFNPLSQNLLRLNERNETQLLQIQQNFNSAAILGDSILFFTKPDKISVFKDGLIQNSFALKLPASDFIFSKLSSLYSNIYLLDSEKGEIIKYASPLEKGKDSPQLWIARSETKKAIGGKSMATDGSVWILNEENIIWRYYGGRFQAELKFDLFPYPKKIYKIFTSATLPYLYLLEPAQNRIIILDKTGKIIKQFQSEKFDNLKDFSISEDGKTIYLLNGLKVYQISFVP